MAKKISEMSALTAAQADLAADLVPVVDVSEASAADRNKRMLLTELAKALPLPRSYLAGYGLANNGVDAVNDIDIAAGAARDSTNAANLIGTAMTKRLDAAWAAGTNQGGLDTGAIANTTYHVFAIRKDSDGSVDYLFSASATAPTMPSGYTYFRRIGSILRESAAIVAFKQTGDEFLRSAAVLDVSDADVGNAAILATLSVPAGIKVHAIIQAALDIGGSNGQLYISSPDQSDQVPNNNAAPLATLGSFQAVSNEHTFARASIRTNTLRQVRYRGTFGGPDANNAFHLATLGWIDRRGRDD